MLKKLEKKRRVLELGFALGFALTVLLTAFAAHRRQVADRVCADTVRLHILANSDTLEDHCKLCAVTPFLKMITNSNI